MTEPEVHVVFTVDAATGDHARRAVHAQLRSILHPASAAELVEEDFGEAAQVRGWVVDGALVPEVWWRFGDTPILQIVGEMFPPEPDRDEFRDARGAFDVDAFEDATDRWRDECLSLAFAAARLPELREPSDRAGRVPDERSARGWLPTDLVAVATLRALLEAEPPTAGGLLGRGNRRHLEAMLLAGDPEVRIPDPDTPGGVPVYEGPASEAHQWLVPGSYRATGMDDQGEFRVVVGFCRVGETMTASAAFPPAEHDSAILNQIARVLEDSSEEQADPASVLAKIDTLVTATGRTGGGSGTLIELDTVLREVITDREQELGPGQPDIGRGRHSDGPDLSR